MATIPELKEEYEGLDQQLPAKSEEAIDPGLLLTFQYDYPDQNAKVEIDTDEFTAVCPWTGLPDYGTLTILVCPASELHRAEVAEILPAVLPGRWNRPGARCQPGIKRPGSLLPT